MRSSNSTDSVVSLNEKDRRGAQHALVVHTQGAQPALATSKTENLFENAKKSTDDSHTAFGNQFVPGMADPKHTPQPTGASTKDNRESYENWLKQLTISDRETFPHHREWQENLRRLGHLGYSPVVTTEDIPADGISVRFKQTVMQHLRNQESHPKLSSFTGKARTPENFSRFSIYVPVIFDSENADAKKTDATARERAWLDAYRNNRISMGNTLSRYQGSAFDELLMMRDIADANADLKPSSMNPTRMQIGNSKFIVVSDHGGNADGTRLQIWSGTKVGFTQASATFKQSLARVDGTEEYDLNSAFLELPSCTIIQINANEVGFCHNRNTQRIERILPGRYVLDRNCHFVGKATLDFMTGKPVVVNSPGRTRSANNAYEQWAQDLSVLSVPQNHIAFINSSEGTFALPHSQTPYLINRRDGFTYVGTSSLSNAICASREPSGTSSYSVVTLQQPGEYVIFKDGATPIVWHYDEANSELNTIHLSSAYFTFDGRVHNNMTEKTQVDSVTVFTRQEAQFAVLRDDAGHIRFLENSGNQPIVLRAPWQHVATVSTTNANYSVNANGANISRILTTESEWIAVKTAEGRFELIPPMLNSNPYYFYQPRYTVLGIVNFRKPGEQKFDVPGIGEVTIVNLQTGTMGLCVINNMNFFLSPAPEPHVFIPPNRYVRTASSTEPYVQHGDLHRFCLAPDQRAVVIKNGRPIVLPDNVASDDAAMIDRDVENGIYTFRAERLKVEGPKQTSEKRYKLGPYEFFNVGVGEIAYGSVNGEVKIWGPGTHRLDNNKNEWLTDFFATNVDPVKIEEFRITSKHGINSHIDIYVTYSIEHPEITIKRFKTHDELHKFIEETTCSIILQLCAKQPPIGYTDGDFSTMQSAAKASAGDDQKDAMTEIEGNFKRPANSLLREYGINLGDMHITKWIIDPDFVQKARELALGLQENRASYEREQINLQKQRVDNETKALQLEQNRLAAVSAAKQSADIQTAQAEANARAEAARAIAEADKKAKVAEAEARIVLTSQKAAAEADVARAEAKTQIAEQKIKELEATRQQAKIENEIAAERAKAQAELRKQTAVLDAETRAFEETAEQRAKAQSRREVAQFELDAAKLEAERMKIQAEAKYFERDLQGKTEAACVGADVVARYKDATGDALIALEIEKMRMQTQRVIAESTKLVVHTMSGNDARDALQTLATPGAIAAQASVINAASMFGIAAPGTRLPSASYLVQQPQVTSTTSGN